MDKKRGTRIRTPADMKKYMAKILCRLEKLPDADLKEKAGQISKIGDTWLRAWKEDQEHQKIRKMEWELYELKTGRKHPEADSEAEIPAAEDQ